VEVVSLSTEVGFRCGFLSVPGVLAFVRVSCNGGRSGSSGFPVKNVGSVSLPTGEDGESIFVSSQTVAVSSLIT